jgi:tetratricopeptide (TPR) repeat protein
VRARATSVAAVASVLAVVMLVALAGPYLATTELAHAKSATTSDRAWQLLRHAHAFDPWNADVVDYQGQVAESAGRFRQAAQLYAKAETLTRLSWAEEYRRARALRAGGFSAASKAACRRAQSLNPLEKLLTEGPCA